MRWVISDAGRAGHMCGGAHAGADTVAAALAQRGGEARSNYRTPVHRQPAMASCGAAADGLPATDALARTNLALPMNPFLRSPHADQVVRAIEGATGAIGHAARVR